MHRFRSADLWSPAVNWSHPTFESIAALLSRRTGLSFTSLRQASAEQGIRRAMRRTGVTDLDTYARLLREEGAAFDELIVELTVGETYFFREPDQFAFIRREVMPELRVREKQPVCTIVRDTSAGCASGEEAYSLAMLFESENLAESAQVLGTDISPAALARARKATYTDWSLRGEGAAQARPYLQRGDGGWW
jgi:chemotaxis protein methyltransferase CheR